MRTRSTLATDAALLFLVSSPVDRFASIPNRANEVLDVTTIADPSVRMPRRSRLPGTIKVPQWT